MKSKITEFQFSTDGKTWHANRAVEDLFFRERIVGITNWSEPFELHPEEERNG